MSHTQAYITAVAEKYASGKATEHTYRPPMEHYLEALLGGVKATNESKRQACGMPDFVLTIERRKQPIDIGYIEAKDIGVDLDKVEKSDQMKRYLGSLDNLILTDYLEFRFFRDQQKVTSIRIAEIENGRIKPLPDQFAALEALLNDFVAYTGQTIKSAKTLAQMMARKAQLMRDVFEKALEDQTSSLHQQLKAFQKILIHDMDEAQFADVYAQTIAYGLFTARLHDHTLDDFSRSEARELIPRSNPFLRKLFDYVCGADLDHRVVWIVDALCEVYRAANVHDILHDFGKQSGRNDPIVHFYETFLAAYDPKLRKARGVWYTPEPVVNFIVRAVDEVLQTHFGLPDGIADTSKVTIEIGDQAFDKRTKTGLAKKKVEVHKVQLLDVAAGTGTFTAEAIKQIHAKLAGMEGMWSQYVEEHLLPRLHGFEILMASYAMCHLKIDLLLTELGYKPTNPQNPPRLGVYLTNALEEHHPDTDSLFATWLAQEANEANRIKRDMPIMVAYGNPPYSVSSQNKGEWITKLCEDYKRDLNEQNMNSLSDDYVKFIRYAEHYVEKAGSGVVAMITNNSYLDGTIHRQMRKHLLETFDKVYVLNLHGDSTKQEVCPDGSPDANVFDIMQGVGIAIMVKDGSQKGKLAEVWHQDYWGGRTTKYDRLWNEEINSEAYQKLNCEAPNYFYVPKIFGDASRYYEFFELKKLFTENGSGVKFRKDNLLVKNNYTISDAKIMVNDVYGLPKSELLKKYNFTETKDWQLDEQRAYFSESKDEDFLGVSYRPLDIRYTFYPQDNIAKIIPRGDSRKALMRNFLLDGNYGLLLKRARMLGGTNAFHHVYLSNQVVDLNFLADQTYCLPLYLYPDTTAAQGSLDDAAGAETPKRRPNLNDKIVAQIAKKLGIPFVPDHEDKTEGNQSCFSPLDLLDYIYGVLHSPTYRETYKEFLKIDFPRIPYPDDAATFFKLAALGAELRAFHLLEHPALAKPITTYPASGDNKVEKPAYKDGRVYINADQYFEGVPDVAWNFYIGGYQPAQKWLKDRKGRTLSFDDIRHYQKIIVALVNTDRLMKEIDGVWKP